MNDALKALQDLRRTKVIVYAQTDRENLHLQIKEDQIEPIFRLLNGLGDQEKIDLFIYSRGGETVVPLPLVRLIRKFCKKFAVLVPFRAHSAATMICIGADEIYMSRKAELGPVDPQSIFMNGGIQKQVSSTDLFSFLEFAKMEIGWDAKNADSSMELLEFLHKYSQLPPDTIGHIYRMFTQSKKYIGELANTRNVKITKAKLKILTETLMSGYGTHSYKIDSHEAKTKLGLNVLAYNKDLENAIENLFIKISEKMKLDEPFAPDQITGQDVMGIIKSEKQEFNKFAEYSPGPPAGNPMTGQVQQTTNLKISGWKAV